MRLAAVGCTLLLSCTTVRTQVSTIPTDVVLEDGRAEPQIDLWIESNRPLSGEQEREYRAQARAALEAALAGRGQPEGDAVLVVRSQGISRTAGRRGDQTAAKVGLIVGAVAVVTLVILAVIADGNGGHHASRAPSASQAAPHAPAAPRPGVAPPRFAPPGPVVAPRRPFAPPFVSAPRVPAVRPAPLPRPLAPAFAGPGLGPYGRGDAEVGIAVELGWWWPIAVEPEPPPYLYPPPPPAERAAPAPAPGAAAPGEGTPGGPPPEGAPPEQRQRRVRIPPEPFTLDDRGFFDGDRLELEAILLDRKTGEALWTKRVTRKADPRDARAVRAAVDELLKEAGWQPPAS